MPKKLGKYRGDILPIYRQWVNIAIYRDVADISAIFVTLIIIVTMIMNNINLSLVLIYTVAAFLTLDAYRIIWIPFLTFSLGTLTWSTQFDQVKHDSQGSDSKCNLVHICSRHAHDQYCGFSFESLALVLLISDYYHLIIDQMIKFYYRW